MAPPRSSGGAAAVQRLQGLQEQNAAARATNSKALRADRQRRRRAEKKADAEDPHLSPGLWAVLMLLFYFSGYDTAAPVEYWQLHRRALRQPPLLRVPVWRSPPSLSFRPELMARLPLGRGAQEPVVCAGPRVAPGRLRKLVVAKTKGSLSL